jgi:hypothetical protein
MFVLFADQVSENDAKAAFHLLCHSNFDARL